jgi:hypothetical protein
VGYIKVWSETGEIETVGNSCSITAKNMNDGTLTTGCNRIFYLVDGDVRHVYFPSDEGIDPIERIAFLNLSLHSCGRSRIGILQVTMVVQGFPVIEQMCSASIGTLPVFE